MTPRLKRQILCGTNYSPTFKNALCIIQTVNVQHIRRFVDSMTAFPDWGFSVLFLSCKANSRVKLAKSGHGPHLFRIIVFCVVPVIVLCYCLYAVLLLLCCTVIVLLCYYLCCPMYWLCVLYHYHRVFTQLQLTNISYHIQLNPVITTSV